MNYDREMVKGKNPITAQENSCMVPLRMRTLEKPYPWWESDALCNECAIVHIPHGKGLLHWKMVTNDFGFSFDEDVLLFINQNVIGRSSFSGGPTLGAYFTRAYENQVLNEEMKHFDDIINLPYKGIKEAINRLGPVLSLLPAGDYLIGDFQLLPIYFIHDRPGIQHFWSYNQSNQVRRKESGMSEYISDRLVFQADSDSFHEHLRFQGQSPSNDSQPSPVFVIPSESSSCANEHRIDTYIELLKKKPQTSFPRAVGLHVDHENVMLLDGHHKAAAAAALGETLPCLVICPVEWKMMTDEQNTLWDSNEPGSRDETMDNADVKAAVITEPIYFQARRHWKETDMWDREKRESLRDADLKWSAQYKSRPLPHKYMAHLKDYQPLLDKLVLKDQIVVPTADEYSNLLPQYTCPDTE